MMYDQNDFAVFILTHGRPDNIVTYKNLLKAGYTGKIYIVIDNEDEKADKYYDKFGDDKVIMFDKKVVAEETDQADNFDERTAIVYARNACFDIAEEVGVHYFLQLDDDYSCFDYRFDENYNYKISPIKNFDKVITLLLDYYKSIPAKCIAMSQGGDFIGGEDNGFERTGRGKRKCMNTFFCSTHRPVKWVGRMNEDVSMYVTQASRGKLFLTVPFVSITQKATQSLKGGMSAVYQLSGTYTKSFYSVMQSPSCVKVGVIRNKFTRLHHRISWDNAVPAILNDKYKKA